MKHTSLINLYDRDRRASGSQIASADNTRRHYPRRRKHTRCHLSGIHGHRKLSPSLWWWTLAGIALPGLALAGSPFATGATASQAQILTILTPVAVIAVMVSGVMAWFGKISWWWLVGVIIGIVLVFGAPQIVSWIRGMFGV